MSIDPTRLKELYVVRIITKMQEIRKLGDTDPHAYIARQQEFWRLWDLLYLTVNSDNEDL